MLYILIFFTYLVISLFKGRPKNLTNIFFYATITQTIAFFELLNFLYKMNVKELTEKILF